MSSIRIFQPMPRKRYFPNELNKLRTLVESFSSGKKANKIQHQNITHVFLMNYFEHKRKHENIIFPLINRMRVYQLILSFNTIVILHACNVANFYSNNWA